MSWSCAVIDDGELLDGVVDADGFFGEAEVIAEPGVGHGGDAGGTLRRRYAGRGAEGKSRILDELCEQYGYHRKHAIRLAQWSGGAPEISAGAAAAV